MRLLKPILILFAIHTMIPGVASQAQDTVPMQQTIYFDLNSDTIDARWLPRLDSIAQYLANFPDSRLHLTASGMSAEDNFTNLLSNRIAMTLAQLATKGISEQHVESLKLVRSEEDTDASRHVLLTVIREH
jgi:outer membrane protein OmpA-like peptidoglycan-associated protein